MSDRLDAVVIGAGIQGAAVALALARRDYKVLVLEQRDVAWATSSRSSKLIHGGLRYLETGQFGLVRECLRERAALLHQFPDLVHLVPFYIPVYRGTRRRPATITLGLTLYGLLTGWRRDARFRRLPRREWDRLDGLDRAGLQAVFQYWDAQTDDAALTRAVLAAAQELGARVKIGAEVAGVEIRPSDCEVVYKMDGEMRTCTARALVNAAGPWANEVLARMQPRQSGLDMELVQGTHIVVDRPSPTGIYYVEAADGRAVFVMPWRGKTLIGTTETPYHGDPAQVKPLEEEKVYLLETAARYFPHLESAVISDAFAGLRVLPAGTGAAFSRPRDTVLHTDRPDTPRLVTIYGGKLTAHRATAERVVRLLKSALEKGTATRQEVSLAKAQRR